jgi:hypothetical protein
MSMFMMAFGHGGSGLRVFLGDIWSSNLHWVVSTHYGIMGWGTGDITFASGLSFDLRSVDWQISGTAPSLRCFAGYTIHDTAGYREEAQRLADREKREREGEDEINPFQRISYTTAC